MRSWVWLMLELYTKSKLRFRFNVWRKIKCSSWLITARIQIKSFNPFLVFLKKHFLRVWPLWTGHFQHSNKKYLLNSKWNVLDRLRSVFNLTFWFLGTGYTNIYGLRLAFLNAVDDISTAVFHSTRKFARKIVLVFYCCGRP